MVGRDKDINMNLKPRKEEVMATITPAQYEKAISELFERDGKFSCKVCSKTYSREKNIVKHIEKEHEKEVVKLASKFFKEDNEEAKKDAIRRENEWFSKIEGKYLEAKDLFNEGMEEYGVSYAIQWYTEKVVIAECKVREAKKIQNSIDEIKQMYSMEDPRFWLKLRKVLKSMKDQVSKDILDNPYRSGSSMIGNQVKEWSLQAVIDFWFKGWDFNGLVWAV